MRNDHFYLFDLKKEEQRSMPRIPFGPPKYNPVSFEEALEIARADRASFPVKHAWDLGKYWLFSYDTGEPPLPGVRSCQINKSTREISYYFPSKHGGIRPCDGNKMF